MPIEYRYGSYRHLPGEVAISNLSVTREFSDRGVAQNEKVTHSLAGYIKADTTALVTAALRDLERAYARQGQDAGLWDSTTGTWTAHFLDSSKALGGVRSYGVSYANGDGGEYTTYRNFQITLEAIYPLADPSGNGLLEFTETLTFRGTGGPKSIYLYPVNGPPVKQTVQQQTTQRVTQSGSAVGKSSYPAVPKPLFPADELEDERQITYTGPKIVGGVKQDFGVQWSYSFEAMKPLQGLPNTP